MEKIQKMNFLKSKKGIGVDDLFPLIFALIVIVVVLSFFIMSPEVVQAKNNNFAEKDIRLVKSYDIFNEYLQTPVFVDSLDKKINVADLLLLYYLEEDSTVKDEYKAILTSNTKRLLNRYEYCYKNPKGNNNHVRGFVVFLTKDLDEYFEGTDTAKERKFRSEYGFENYWDNKFFQPMPLLNGETIYIVFFDTHNIDKLPPECK